MIEQTIEFYQNYDSGKRQPWQQYKVQAFDVPKANEPHTLVIAKIDASIPHADISPLFLINGTESAALEAMIELLRNLPGNQGLGIVRGVLEQVKSKPRRDIDIQSLDWDSIKNFVSQL